MTASLAIAKTFDFSGLFPEYEQHGAFGKAVIANLRERANFGGGETVLIVDEGFGLGDRPFAVVKDHINFTGYSPLIGPNDHIGPRFPIINHIYTGLDFKDVPQGVAGGLNPNCHPNKEDIEFMTKVGVDFWSYNLVPSMMVAAHAGWKVFALLVHPNSATGAESARALLVDGLKICARGDQ
jgi:hypothetical protein